MPTSVREHALAWVKTRLATIAGYTILRNPTEDDLFSSLPALMSIDGGEGYVERDSGERVFELEAVTVAVVRVTGANSGEAAGALLSDAVAKIQNAIMNQAAWPSCVDDDGRPIISNIRPGDRPRIEFPESPAAEDVLALAAIFFVEYATTDADAYDSSP